MLFVMTSGISIQLKPFRIDITYPYFGLGIVLTAIGLPCVSDQRTTMESQITNTKMAIRKDFMPALNML